MPLQVVSELQRSRDGFCVNGKTGGMNLRRVGMMGVTVLQLNRSFTHHQSNVTGPMWQLVVSLATYMRKYKYSSYMWRSVRHPVCPTDPLSHFCLKNSICPQQQSQETTPVE